MCPWRGGSRWVRGGKINVINAFWNVKVSYFASGVVEYGHTGHGDQLAASEKLVYACYKSRTRPCPVFRRVVYSVTYEQGE